MKAASINFILSLLSSCSMSVWLCVYIANMVLWVLHAYLCCRSSVLRLLTVYPICRIEFMVSGTENGAAFNCIVDALQMQGLVMSLKLFDETTAMLILT